MERETGQLSPRLQTRRGLLHDTRLVPLVYFVSLGIYLLGAGVALVPEWLR